MHTHHHRHEQGSILPFVALAMVLAGASMVLLARIGGAATAPGRGPQCGRRRRPRRRGRGS